MGIRTRRARQHSKTHIVAFSIVGAFGFLALLGLALALSLGSLVELWLQDLPDYASADAYLVAEPTQVYDADGNVIAEFYLQNRRSVTMEEISPYVIQGTIDTEDIRFYQHNGVDVQGIARAAFAILSGGHEGASTITQQLVRNTVLSDEQFEQSLKRKVREAYIAIELEKVYTKDQILLMYLNTIYYGHGAYGIEAASRTYFNKHASDLTLAEAALLAGLPQSPSSYDPTANPDLAVWRRNIVLDRMLTAGDITQEEHDAAIAEELNLNLGESVMEGNGTYPYWTNYVKALLEEDFEQETIFRGGLQIYTTIDPEWQRAAEEAVNEQLAELGDDELESALVAVDPATGYIRAMVGGRDFERDQFNLATQARRQPGSSFKMITLVTAISQGMNPNVVLNCNSPLQVTPTWKVQNYANANYGNVTLARATEVSSNTGYVQVAEVVGAENIVSTAHAMGITVDIPAYSSITLGTIGTPPVQMAEAYATLATGGIHRDAIAITKILDRNGNVVYEHTDNPTRAITPEVAYAATQVLRGVVDHSGATGTVVYNYCHIPQPIAGKTGTTENARDLWFCGYTPTVSVAVWTGYRQERMVTKWGVEAHPSDTSVPIFGRFVQKILGDAPATDFPLAETPRYKNNTEWKFSNTTATETDEERSKREEEERQKREEEERKKKEEERGGRSPGRRGGGASPAGAAATAAGAAAGR